MDFLATPDTVTGTAGSTTPGAPSRVGLLTDGTSPNDASLNYAKYYNMLLEEMRNLITTFGGTPDEDNWHQAGIALLAKIGTVGGTSLQAQIDNITGTYPKIVAAGNGDFSFATAGSAHVLTATQPVPSPIDLTNTTKYALQFTFHGAGVTDSDQKYVTWSCTKAAGSSFDLELHIYNDSSSLFNNGTANYTWSVIQLTA